MGYIRECSVGTGKSIFTAKLIERVDASFFATGVLRDNNVGMLLCTIVGNGLLDANLDSAGLVVGSTAPSDGLPADILGGEVVFYALVVGYFNRSECALRSEP